jgi:RNA polymerase sigma-70 factor (ECF subfamily)
MEDMDKPSSDVELLRDSAARPAVFEEIVNRYQRAFVRKAMSILHDEDDAYDVVQETFVRIYVAGKRFEEREGASFSSWAYTVLVNQCYTAYRKRRRKETVSLEAVPEFAETVPDPVSADLMERRYAADQAMRMLSKLPVLLRRTVEQHFIDGMPQKEIAEKEGVSHGTIRQRIHRAKQKMREAHLELAYVTSQIK